MPGNAAGGRPTPAADIALNQGGSTNPLQIIGSWFDALNARTSGLNPLNAGANGPGIHPSTLWGNQVTQQNAMQAEQINAQPLSSAGNFLSSAIGRPVSTVGTYLNPSSRASLYQAGPIEGLRQAWDASADVTAMQSALSNPLLAKNTFTGKNIWTGQHTLFGGIDPTDPAVRKQAFEDNPFGELASGSGDAIIQTIGSYYLAPDVLVGQIAKPLIAGQRGARFATATTRAAEKQALSPYLTPETRAGLAPPSESTAVVPYTAEGAVAEPAKALTEIGTGSSKRSVGTILSQNLGRSINEPAFLAGIRDMYNNRAAPGFVANHWMVQNSIGNKMALANSLSHAQSFDEFATIYMAARGDVAADQLLRFQYASVWDQLKRNNIRLDANTVAGQDYLTVSPEVGELDTTGYPYALQPGTAAAAVPRIVTADSPARTITLPGVNLSAADRAEQMDIINDLVRRSDYLRRAIGVQDNDPGVRGALAKTGFATDPSLNQARLETAARKSVAWGNDTGGYWHSQMFEPIGSTGATVKVLNWLGSAAPRGWVSTSGAGALGSEREVLATLKSAGADPATTSAWMDRYLAQYTPAGREQTLIAMENDLTEKMAIRHLGTDASPDQLATLKANAGTLLRQMRQSRADALTQWKRNDGYLFDVVTGRKLKVPQLETQMAQAVPMIDFDRLDAAMRHAATSPGGLGQYAWTQSKMIGEQVMSWTMQLWKPAVLLRLGAIPRNVGESWLASYIFLGRFPGNPLTGTLNIGRNSYNRLMDMTEAGRAHAMGNLSAKEQQQAFLDKITEYEGKKIGYRNNIADIEADLAQKEKIWPDSDIRAGYVAEAEADKAQQQALIDALDSQVADTRTQMSALAEAHKHKAAKAGQEGLTTDALTAAGIDPAHGSAEGWIADIMAKNFSADSKNELLLHSLETKGFLARSFNRRVYPTGGTKQYNPGELGYWDASAHWANANLRPSEVGMRLAAEQSPDDVLAWLNTPAGSAHLHQLNIEHYSDQDILEHLRDLQHNILAAYPSEGLRARIAQGPITSDDVIAHLGGLRNEDLTPILDDELLRMPAGYGGVSGSIERFIDRAFHFMWTLPEDRLARWPLYNTIYKQSIMQQLKDYEPELLTMTNDRANAFIRNTIEPRARYEGQNTVTRVIYSAQNRTAPAEALRYISPFYQVTANRFAYYGSQFLENPQNMARLFNGWNSVSTQKDVDGNNVIVVHLPGFLAKFMGIEDTPRLTFQKSSLNLISNSEPWYSPGFGPPVTIPMAEIMRRTTGHTPPWLEKLVGSTGLSTGMFPNNYYGDNAAEQLMPTWMRRAKASTDRQWMNSFTQVYAVELMKYKNGDRPDPPTDEEITNRTNGLWTFRLLASVVSPSQPTLTNEVLGPMVDTYRGYQKKYGQDADAHFLADFPQYYDYMVSVSKNATGVAPTQSAYGRAQDNADLIANLPDPSMAAMITNLPSDAGLFNSAAYAAEYGRPIGPGSATEFRGAQTPEEALNRRIASRGWNEYGNLVKTRDALLAQFGFKDMNQSGAELIKAAFEAGKNQIIRDTMTPDGSRNADGSYNQVSPWWEDYQQQDNALYAKRADTLTRILNAPGYVANNIGVQPWLSSAAEYLQARNQVTAMLAGQQSQDLNARGNEWLKAAWQARVTAISDADPVWKDWQARYFAHDDLTEVPAS
jgi:hypothetical protein